MREPLIGYVRAIQIKHFDAGILPDFNQIVVAGIS
jgi:hypothetical protein